MRKTPGGDWRAVSTLLEILVSIRRALTLDVGEGEGVSTLLEILGLVCLVVVVFKFFFGFL